MPLVNSARILPFIILVLMIFELIVIYTGSKIAMAIVSLMVILLPILGFRYLKLREFYVLTASVILGVLLFVNLSNPFEILVKGFDRAGFLASFILLMGVMRSAAITSPAILECGRYVTQQPPQRRFLGVMFGSHVFSSLLNVGALSLLVPIVQRGIRYGKPEGEPLDEIALIRERRQVTAILRGFAWFLIWSPTAVTQAVLPTLLVGVDILKLMIVGFVVAFIMMVIAWIEDLVRWGPLRRRLLASGKYPYQSTPEFPKKYTLDLAVVFCVLIALSAFLKWVGGVNFISGIMLAAPIILVGWVYVQAEGRGFREKRNEVSDRVQNVVMVEQPAAVREIVSFSSAGFIGTVAAYLLPTSFFVTALSIDVFPSWLVMLELTAVVLIAGQIGLSPVTMAVFLGSAVAEVPQLPMDVTLAALAIACGSSVSTLGAPFAAGILMLSRVSGYETRTLSWEWNLVYSLMCLAGLAVIFMVLSVIF